MSKIAEIVLHISYGKKPFKNEAELAAFLEERRAKNAQPYIRLKSIRLDACVQETVFEGMQVFVLSPPHQPQAAQKAAMPKTEKPHPFEKRIFYLHGGSYFYNPDPAHWRMLDKLIRKTGASVVLPVYPKAPNYSCRESFEKVFAYYKAALAETSPENLVLMGDSSGGGFALAFAQLLKNRGLPVPENTILISPWLDISMKNPEIPALEPNDPMLSAQRLRTLGMIWAAGEASDSFIASPIHVRPEELKHITLFTGTHEILYPDARKFAAMARKRQADITYYEYDKMNHVFPLYPIPEARDAIAKISGIINGSRPAEPPQP